MRFRSWIVTTIVVGIVQATLSLLLILQHDALYSELLKQRVSVIAQTTAETFRPILDLGMPISMLRDGDRIVGRGIEIDPSIIAVHAVNPSGIITHSTQPKPATITEGTLGAMRFAESDLWSHETQQVFYSGFTLRREGEDPSGAVVVEYPHTPLDQASTEISRSTMRSALLVMLGTSAVAFCLIYLLLGRPRRKLVELKDALDSGQTEISGPASTTSLSGNLLDAEIAQLSETLRAAENAYHSAQRAILAPAQAVQVQKDASVGDGAAVVPEHSVRLKSAIVTRTVPVMAVLIMASALVLTAFVIPAVTKSIEPELAARTDLIGKVVSENVQRALQSGIALDEIVGGDQFFGDMLKRLPEVAYIAVATGRIMIEAGERIDPYLAPPRERRDVRSHPIFLDGKEVAYVIIDIDPRLITKRFQGMFLDAAVVVIVTMLLAYEAMLLLAGRALAGGLERVQRIGVMQAAGDFSRRVTTNGQDAIQTLLRTLSDRAIALQGAFVDALSAAPAGDRTALERVGTRFGLSVKGPRLLETSSFTDIRLALFFFAAADELPLAFLPLYTRAADNLWSFIDGSILIALPLAGYLLGVVIVSPYARVLVERLGVRGVFLAAAIPTLAAHIGLFAASTAQEIILWRSVTGFGYALVTLAAQDYALGISSQVERDRMLGSFTLVLFGGIFSGVALGGVLADRLGQANVFLVSATLIGVSIFLTRWLINSDVGREARQVRVGQQRTAGTAITDPQLLTLICGIAIPGNVILQAFVSYLVALSLDAQGATSAEIGRILMLYFLAIIAVSPVGWRLTARLPGEVVVLGGAILSAVALLAVATDPSPLTMALAMIGTGAGAALIRGTQVSLALSLAEKNPAHIGPAAVLGALRTGERIGSIFGLVLIAAIAGAVGYQMATLAMAFWVFAGAAFYAAVRSRQILASR